MKYLNEVDGLKVVVSLTEFNDLVDELRLFTMPPVLAGLERLDATDRFIAAQLTVPEMMITNCKTGKAELTTDHQISLCNMLERGIKIYEDILLEHERDNVERPFYETGVLKEHIRCAKKLLNIQLEMISAKTSNPNPSKKKKQKIE